MLMSTETVDGRKLQMLKHGILRVGVGVLKSQTQTYASWADYGLSNLPN